MLTGTAFMPFLIGNTFLVIGFLFSFFVFLRKRLKFDSFIFVFAGGYLLLFIGHIFHFSTFQVGIFFGLFMRIFFAYFVIKVIGSNVAEYFLRLMYFFTIISLVVWIILLLVPSSIDFFVNRVCPNFEAITLYKPCEPHIIIFTFNIRNGILPRNSGPFWEPGGFGVFLVIALIFNLIKTKNMFEKRNVIFLIALLTTQSTGAYLTFAVLVIVYLISKRKFNYLILGLPVFIFLFIYYFKEFDFLSKKIFSELEFIEGQNTTNLSRTRLVSAIEDWKIFINYPLIGEGRFTMSEYGEFGNQGLNYRNNGTMRLLAEFGLLGFVFYFSFMYRSFKAYCLKNNLHAFYALGLIFVLITAAFSQVILMKPFFIGLCFMFLTIKINKPEQEAIMRKVMTK